MFCFTSIEGVHARRLSKKNSKKNHQLHEKRTTPIFGPSTSAIKNSWNFRCNSDQETELLTASLSRKIVDLGGGRRNFIEFQSPRSPHLSGKREQNAIKKFFQHNFLSIRRFSVRFSNHCARICTNFSDTREFVETKRKKKRRKIMKNLENPGISLAKFTKSTTWLSSSYSWSARGAKIPKPTDGVPHDNKRTTILVLGFYSFAIVHNRSSSSPPPPLRLCEATTITDGISSAIGSPHHHLPLLPEDQRVLSTFGFPSVN